MRLFLAPTLLICALASVQARASGLPINPGDFSNPGALIPADTANAFITTIGLIAEQRPYEPATPLGTSIGLDLGIQATLMKIPESFQAALASAGVNGSALPVLPMAKLDLHKGFGSKIDIGISAILYQGYEIYGGDLKYVVYQPEEGLTWALRFCYAYANLQIVTTRTYTPQIVASRRLDFADPYFGIGYSFVMGNINFPVALNTGIPGAPTSVDIQASGRGGAADAFLGVAFRVPIVSLLLVMEGSYNTAGADTLGAKFGFSF